MNKEEPFRCEHCQQWKPKSEIGKTWVMKTNGALRCKACVGNTVAGDMDAIKAVPDEIGLPVNYEHGYCKCGNIDQLQDGKCNECLDASESRRNKAVRHQPEAAAKPVDMVARQSVVNAAGRKLKASGRIR